MFHIFILQQAPSQLRKFHLVLKKANHWITGKTGSGKTTLFLIMLGLLKPSSGSILFNNKELKSNLKKWRSK